MNRWSPFCVSNLYLLLRNPSQVWWRWFIPLISALKDRHISKFEANQSELQDTRAHRETLWDGGGAEKEIYHLRTLSFVSKAKISPLSKVLGNIDKRLILLMKLVESLPFRF